MSEIAYPRPIEDADNAAFLSAWQEEGRILLQRSKTAKRCFFYPRPFCPFSGRRDLENITASGKGTLVGWSVVYRPNDPAFDDDVPIILAEIRLQESASLLARIVGSPPSRLKTGCAVETVPMPAAAKYPLPTFQLA